MPQSSLDSTPKKLQHLQKIPWAVLVPTIEQWFEQNGRSLPWRRDFQRSQDPWCVWVSEVMLQQTVIKVVIPAYERFLKLYPTPEHLANATTEQVKLAVRGLGYYRRFDLLHRGASEIIRRGSWPTDMNDWLTVPGVGPYTARAIASIVNREPVGVVDGNVERVMSRVIDWRGPPNAPVFKRRLQDALDGAARFATHPGNFNQGVMEIGQTLCTPTKPECSVCPVSRFCASFKASSQDVSPGPKAQKEMVDVRINMIIEHDGERVILKQRSMTERFLRGSVGFETIVHDREQKEIPDGMFAGSFRHSITHHRLAVDVYSKVVKKKLLANNRCRLVNYSKVEENLISNLDRKAWKQFSLQMLTPKKLKASSKNQSRPSL